MRRLSCILLLTSSFAFAKPDPLAASAEYYFARHDYQQALRLWNEVLLKDPANDAVALRVADLQFFFDGRQVARAGLAQHLSQRGESLSREGRRALLERWRLLETSFLTEEGQSLYLQAKEREGQGDCPGAIALLTRAIAAEKGNLDLLKARARCELLTENFSGHYESLKQAYGEFPYDVPLQEELAEAHLRFQQPQRVVEMWQKDTEAPSARKRLALVFAYLDIGDESKAATLLVRPNDARGVEPAWNFLFGALAARRESVPEALTHWQTFLDQLEKRPPPASDPYRLSSRAEEVRAWIVRKAPPKSVPPVTKNVS